MGKWHDCYLTPLLLVDAVRYIGQNVVGKDDGFLSDEVHASAAKWEGRYLATLPRSVYPFLPNMHRTGGGNKGYY